jgi:hypothetical protein
VAGRGRILAEVLTTVPRIRLFLFVEGASFLLASSIHRGLLVAGYAHQAASIAESVIAAVVLIALLLTFVWPARTRVIALIGQAFAALGTLVGVSMIIIGIGPRTAPDVVYHLAILIVLAWGLTVAFRTTDAAAHQPAHAR